MRLSAINRSPKKSESGGNEVYAPGNVMVGAYSEKEVAQYVAASWSRRISNVVVIDRQERPLGVNTPNRSHP
jgi:hypothetical protein